MKKRLYLTALLTTPIIAIYGASPLYIFKVLPLADFTKVSIGISTHVLLVWAAHLYCIHKFPAQKAWQRFLITYVASAILQIIPRLIFGHVALSQSPPFRYIAYPVINSFAVNALVMIISNSIVASARKIAAEKEVQQLMLENSEAQKQVLMRQLQPHFLFNALSVLKSLIGEDRTAAEDYAVKLSGFLRYSVQAHKSDLVTLAEELKFTDDYLDLQRLRFNESFRCDTGDVSAALSLRIPVFALQTVVENAFKHNHFTVKVPLVIRINYADGGLVISNNKSSIKQNEDSGTGLKNLDERYRLITGKNIVVTDSTDHFSISLPLI